MWRTARVRRPVQQIFSLVAGGNHVWGASVLSWNASVSRSATENQGYLTSNFSNNDPNSPINNVVFGVNLNNRYRPIIYPQNNVNIYDPSQYFLQNLDFDYSRSAQLNLLGSVDYSKSYNWNGHFG